MDGLLAAAPEERSDGAVHFLRGREATKKRLLQAALAPSPLPTDAAAISNDDAAVCSRLHTTTLPPPTAGGCRRRRVSCLGSCPHITPLPCRSHSNNTALPVSPALAASLAQVLAARSTDPTWARSLAALLPSPLSVEGLDPRPGRYCLRLHKNRVYYASELLVHRATAVSRVHLAGVRTPIGAFHLTVHTLDLLAAHAHRCVWLKPDTECSFLFGNFVPKSALARITENTKAGDCVTVMSMANVPLGFGVASKGAQDCRKADTNAVVVLHQSDAGEYLRKEEGIM